MKKYILLGVIALVALIIGPAMAGPTQGFSGTLSCSVGVTVVPGNTLNFPTFTLGDNIATPVYVNETDGMCAWEMTTAMDHANTGYMYSGANHLTKPLGSNATYFGPAVTNGGSGTPPMTPPTYPEAWYHANQWTESGPVATTSGLHFTNWSVAYNQTVVSTDPFGTYSGTVLYNIAPA